MMTRKARIFVPSLCLVLTFCCTLAWAGRVANPIPELAKKINLSDLSPVEIDLKGVLPDLRSTFLPDGGNWRIVF